MRGRKFGHIVTEETRRKLREFNLGKKESDETRNKKSKVFKEGYNNGTRKSYWKNKKQSEQSSIKKSDSIRGKSYEELMGKKKALELKQIRRLSIKGQFPKGQIPWNKGKHFNKKTREKIKEIMTNKWKDEKYRENQTTKILRKRPTSYEKKISEICIENHLPFVYTGNGTFLIGYKNPDFVNQKDKIVIEVYYSWFKIRDYGSCENYEKKRRKYFVKYGWNTIFIRDDEINAENWKEICLNKIQGRIG